MYRDASPGARNVRSRLRSRGVVAAAAAAEEDGDDDGW